MIVVLSNIRSLHNVGSIFRTADAAAVEKIYLAGITPTPVDEFGRPRQPLEKVSLSAEKYVKWEYAKSATRLITKFRKDGFKIFAIEQNKKSVPYYKIPRSHFLNSKFCLVLGSETKGLPPAVLKLADRILEIPMKGKKESLNVSVAFGVVAFHIVKIFSSEEFL